MEPTEVVSNKAYVEGILDRCFRDTREYALFNASRKRRPEALFCGMQPVSMTKELLRWFSPCDYVTPKTDGWRYLLIVTPRGFFGVGRDHVIERLEDDVVNRFSHQFASGFFDSSSSNLMVPGGETVLDMEVIALKTNEEEGCPWDYMFAVFDLVMFKGVSCAEWEASKRLSIISKWVLKEDDRSVKRSWFKLDANCNIKNALHPTIRAKAYYSVNDICNLEAQLEQTRWNGCDGIIMMQANAKYIPHASNSLVKLKKAKYNTIDFKVEVERTEVGVKINYRVISRNDQYSTFDSKETKTSDEVLIQKVLTKHGTIQACFWNASKECWVMANQRVDKTTPNTHEVALNIFKSIKENVSTEDVLANVSSSTSTARDRQSF